MLSQAQTIHDDSSLDFISPVTTREQTLFQLAYFDELTGLPNKRLIKQQIDSLGATGQRFAFAFLDIDNFKQINDYYGHGTGDAFLKAFARRVAGCLRATDAVGRLSGDEFVLLLDSVEDEKHIQDLLSAIMKRIREPYFVDNCEIFSSASVGVSVYPDHGSCFDSLSEAADIAMYRIKNSAKGSFEIFDLQMGRANDNRTSLEQSLRLAIQDRRFFCAFQPKVDIRTRETTGVEALVRFRDEHNAIQAPGAFINLAVELGLIDEITHLVLDEVSDSIDLINEAFGRDVSISLNVAAKQAGSLPFMSSFVKALVQTGYPERFILEITEDAFISKTDFQNQIVPIIGQAGARISIDDFGVGYSSLSALADITAHELKIDRSFITDIHLRPRSQAVLRSIEALARSLGMIVIAEGVETYEELAFLQAATQMRYAQGYYFSKPIIFPDRNRSLNGEGFAFAKASRISEPARQRQTRSAR